MFNISYICKCARGRHHQVSEEVYEHLNREHLYSLAAEEVYEYLNREHLYSLAAEEVTNI